ncbi:MAG: hypothetical protein GY943_04835 [Chloroflexi bacterium]|nr:hypothetical protein [Chloroflexota bacterium]
MKDNKTRMQIIIGFLGSLTLICFLSVLTIRSGGNSQAFYWGILIGIIPGVATWFYMHDTWDPANLRPKNEKIKTLNPKFITIVVASGMIASRIFTRYFSDNLNRLLMGFMMGWVFMTIGYMVIQLWRHR